MKGKMGAARVELDDEGPSMGDGGSDMLQLAEQSARGAEYSWKGESGRNEVKWPEAESSA